jgi:tetratricopeptide (TPR) repeat protein
MKLLVGFASVLLLTTAAAVAQQEDRESGKAPAGSSALSAQEVGIPGGANPTPSGQGAETSGQGGPPAQSAVPGGPSAAPNGQSVAPGGPSAAPSGQSVPGEAGATDNQSDATGENKPAPNIKGQLMSAGQLMVEGKYADAADIYQQALTLIPSNVDALAGLGMALGRQQKLDDADTQFDKVLALDNNNAVAHCGKAMVFLSRFANVPESDKKARAGFLKQAGRECNKALDADSRVVEAHYLLGKVYREEGRLDRAEQAFSGAVKLDPHYANAWAALGMVQVQAGKLSQAAENLKKATDISPHNSTAYFGLGQMYMKQGQVDRAVREFNMSVYNNPNNEPVHIALGKAYEIQGDNVAAVKEFHEAVKIKPDDSDAYLCLAGNYLARGEVENALAKLRQGLQVLPNDPGLHMAIADAGLKAGKISQAVVDYEVVLTAQPGNGDAALGLLRAFYVRSLKESMGGFARSSDYDRAKSLINHAIQENPGDLSLRYAGAGMAALSGQMPSLDQMGPPKTDTDRIALAEALLAEHKFRDADDELRRVVNDTSTAKEALHLADLAVSVSALDAAESAYRKALTYVNGDTRARQGLDAISKIRQTAHDDYSQADELLRRRMYIQSAEKFRSAVCGDPRNAEAHQGLAESLERLTFTQPADTARNYREAISQYKIYLQLTPSIPAKYQEKFARKITKLDDQARKLEGPKATPDRVSTYLNAPADARRAPAPRD